jgi:hypothetical protein
MTFNWFRIVNFNYYTTIHLRLDFGKNDLPVLSWRSAWRDLSCQRATVPSTKNFWLTIKDYVKLKIPFVIVMNYYEDWIVFCLILPPILLQYSNKSVIRCNNNTLLQINWYFATTHDTSSQSWQQRRRSLPRH